MNEPERIPATSVTDAARADAAELAITIIDHDSKDRQPTVTADEAAELTAKMGSSLEDGSEMPQYFALPSGVVLRLLGTIRSGDEAQVEAAEITSIENFIKRIRSVTFTQVQGDQIVDIVRARTRLPRPV